MIKCLSVKTNSRWSLWASWKGKAVFICFLSMVFTTFEASAQNTTVSGTILSTEGNEPLPGANIIEKGTTNGTVTNANGNYSLSVSEGASLVFTSIGYQTLELIVGNKTVIEIRMVPDIQQLEEIVVVGYGTQQKSDLTGAIASVDDVTITERGFTNPVQGIQGSMPGVQIANSTGRVGDPVSIVVRGKGTFQEDGDPIINNSLNAPLFVVDGVITENIDFLNPNDIAKIDVLKDAASAAIYGSRGSNGVVIVQTKEGANVPSGTSISLNSFFGVKKNARLPDMMTPEQWRRYHMSAYIATVNPDVTTTPEEYNNVVLGPANPVLQRRFDELDGYDWYDGVLKDGFQSNNHLSIMHRDGNSAYSLGIGYQTETGNIENEGLDKFTLRLGIDQEIGSKLTTGGSLNVSQSDIERGSDVGMREALRLNPFLHPWAIDENGNNIIGELFPQPGKLLYPDGTRALDKTSTYNPILEINNSRDNTRQWNVLGSVYLQYQIIEGLNIKTALSAGLTDYRRGKSWGLETNTGLSNGPSSEVENFENFNYTWDNQIDYSRVFGKHSIQAMALNSVFVDRTERTSMSSTDQPFETEYFNVASGPQSSYFLESDFMKSQLCPLLYAPSTPMMTSTC